MFHVCVRKFDMIDTVGKITKQGLSSRLVIHTQTKDTNPLANTQVDRQHAASCCNEPVPHHTAACIPSS